MDKIAASIAQIAAEALEREGADPRASADLPAPVMDALKAWIADQPEPRPSVSEAVRLGLGEWLSGKGYGPAAGSSGE
ncbi:hypothetical protein [Methylobacterium sp. J-076]|uniref:hypothetical protein n=1 Tax=Methylobacterium sp. J-076 TaxID=2836655 RepID=UPI001FB89F30|nr:hypothetical protein [Methylobacterium sp. J-076]MCJ2014053.1 hypothetical protein [Methylobacterium sp. J-076]